MFISPRMILYYKRTTYQANHAYSRLVKGDGFWIVVCSMVHSAIKWRLSGVFGRSSLCSLVVPYITQMWHKVG